MTRAILLLLLSCAPGRSAPAPRSPSPEEQAVGCYEATLWVVPGWVWLQPDGTYCSLYGIDAETRTVTHGRWWLDRDGTLFLSAGGCAESLTRTPRGWAGEETAGRELRLEQRRSVRFYPDLLRPDYLP